MEEYLQFYVQYELDISEGYHERGLKYTIFIILKPFDSLLDSIVEFRILDSLTVRFHNFHVNLSFNNEDVTLFDALNKPIVYLQNSGSFVSL